MAPVRAGFEGTATTEGLMRERLAGAIAALLWDADAPGAAELSARLGSATRALDLVALDVSEAMRDPERSLSLADDLEWIARGTPALAPRALALRAALSEVPCQALLGVDRGDQER